MMEMEEERIKEDEAKKERNAGENQKKLYAVRSTLGLSKDADINAIISELKKL